MNTDTKEIEALVERIDIDELKRILRYDPDTGRFYWRITLCNRAIAGKEAANSRNSWGYASIWLKGKYYKAHRLAWFYAYGQWPNNIDHINGDKTDNRICNLRSVTIKENTHNQRKAQRSSSTGLLGVVAKQSGKFAAEIRVNGKKIHLGTFETPEQASDAYWSAKMEMHEGAIRPSSAGEPR